MYLMHSNESINGSVLSFTDHEAEEFGRAPERQLSKTATGGAPLRQLCRSVQVGVTETATFQNDN